MYFPDPGVAVPPGVRLQTSPGSGSCVWCRRCSLLPLLCELVLFSLKGSRTGLQQQGPRQHEPFSNNFSSFPEKGQFPCVRPQRVQANVGLPCGNVTKQIRDIVNMKGLGCILHAQKTLLFSSVFSKRLNPNQNKSSLLKQAMASVLASPEPI